MGALSDGLYLKYENLKKTISDMGSLAVAFSGGVDSSLLLKVAHDVLGDKAAAITAVSELMPEREREEAFSFCRKNDIRQIIIKPNPLSLKSFCDNPRDRCYICKKHIFGEIIKKAEEHGFSNVAEGSNIDDLGDFRPGLKALGELLVRSPLCEAQLTKNEIRALSKELMLATCDKPSYACLASRFVYGEKISAEKLSMIDNAEQYLYELGFRGMRVRLHQNVARIELTEEDIDTFFSKDHRISVYNKLKELGFDYVALDLKGYTMGGMNL